MGVVQGREVKKEQGMLCFFKMPFRLFLRQLKFKLSNPNTVQNGRLYVVFSFYTTTCIVIFCSLFTISVIYLQ